MVIDTGRWSNRTTRCLVLLAAIATFAISAANMLVSVFDLKQGFYRNWRWWAAVVSWLALILFAREMFLLWKAL